MSGRVLVYGEMGWWLRAGRLLAAVAVMAMLATVVMGAPLAIWGLAFAVVVCAVLEATAWVRRRRRTWIEVEPEGFTVVDRRGSRQVADHQVVGMAYSVCKRFSNGTHSGDRRTCRLWLSSDPNPLVMDNTYKLGHVDPMRDLIGRLHDLLRDGFRAAWEHDVPIQGDGWELHRRELRYQDRKRSSLQVLPISEIAAVEFHDGRMGVWRRGEELPCVQFDPNGRNTWLLESLLADQLPASSDTAQLAGGTLGRILFRRKMKRSDVWILNVVTGLCVVTGVGLLFAPHAKLAEGAYVALPLAAITGLAAFIGSRIEFRVHALGVFKTWWVVSRTLLYSDMEAFAYSARVCTTTAPTLVRSCLSSSIPNRGAVGEYPIAPRCMGATTTWSGCGTSSHACSRRKCWPAFRRARRSVGRTTSGSPPKGYGIATVGSWDAVLSDWSAMKTTPVRTWMGGNSCCSRKAGRRQ